MRLYTEVNKMISCQLNLRRRVMVLALSALIFTTLTARIVCAADDPNRSIIETPAQYQARIQWWRDARFGLFMHWGPVSLMGTEIGWSRGGERRGLGPNGTQIPVEVYDNLYKRFNPSKFNADEWVAIAKAAGMKYMILTSRHHDGFSMFDTKASDYKITSPDSPFGRDIVKELADACHRAGFKFGVYYSQPNWQNADAYTERHDKYKQFLKQQVRELLTNYGVIDILWYDGLMGTAEDYDSLALNKMARQLQPNILINNRNRLPEDFDTPEQTIGVFQNKRPWESCMTICNQWAWMPNDTMKSLEQCLQTLIRCAGGDGNLLFNVGPMPTGEIEPRQVDRLKQMGDWLAIYGKTIYGTRGGPIKPGIWGASTFKGNTVYLHLFNWSETGVVLPPITRHIRTAKLLLGGKARVRQTAKGVTVWVDPKDRDAIDTVVELKLDGNAASITPVGLPSGIKATASNVYANQEDYTADKAFDGSPGSRWATDGGVKRAWIERQFDKPVLVSGVSIGEAIDRIQSFLIQVPQAGKWVTVYRGGTVGPSFITTFPAVRTDRVRMVIMNATDGPTIYEINYQTAE